MENTFSQNKKLNGRHDIGSRKEDLWQKEKSHNDIFAESSQSVQFSSVAQSCPTLCDPMNRSTPGLLSITNSRSSLKLMSTDSWVSPTPRYISGKNRNTNSKRYIHPSGHSSIIYNSQDMKATQAPVAR